MNTGAIFLSLQLAGIEIKIEGTDPNWQLHVLKACAWFIALFLYGVAFIIEEDK